MNTLKLKHYKARELRVLYTALQAALNSIHCNVNSHCPSCENKRVCEAFKSAQQYAIDYIKGVSK